jgi:hypothetical protein
VQLDPLVLTVRLGQVVLVLHLVATMEIIISGHLMVMST